MAGFNIGAIESNPCGDIKTDTVHARPGTRGLCSKGLKLPRTLLVASTEHQ